jgi:hypothetical protein
MAKKKSLFKKIRKEQSSVVAEPDAALDDLDMQSLDTVEEVAPVAKESCTSHCAQALHCTA